MRLQGDGGRLNPELIDILLPRRMNRGSPFAVRMTKRLMMRARHASLDTVLDLSAAMQSLAHTTPDYREAMDAFREKRPARFEGR